MTCRRALPAALLLFLLTACGADGPRHAESTVPEWPLEEVVRIGSVDGEVALTQVGVVMLAPDGRILVAQPRDAAVRVFAPDGSPAGMIGRRGGGPGEFQFVSGLGFQGDTLWVSDSPSRRVSWFGPDGAFLDSREWATERWSMEAPARGAYLPTPPEVILPDGSGVTLTGRAIAMMTGGAPEAREPSLVRGSPIVRFDTTGTILDTLAWEQNRSGNTLLNFQGRPLVMRMPVNDGPLVAIARDGGGAVVAERTLPPGPEPGWLLRRLTSGRDTVFERRLPYTPVPLPGAYVTRLAEERAAAYSRGAPGLTAAQIEAAWRDADFVPETLPPVTGLVATQDGRIWVRREEPAAGEPARWEVFDAQGQAIGRLQLPAAQQVQAAAGDRLVVLEHDELDVPYLVVYRIQEG
ncbi:MAG: hypothetical protein WEB88_04125 [Gemmatimonadota bacterium]